MEIVLHGGEPTLLGLKRFKKIIVTIKENLSDYLKGLAIQTNATLITEEWAELFAQYDIAVGVSLDGSPSTHDAHRVDHRGRGSYSKVVNGLKILQKIGLNPGILCVVNPKESGAEVYKHFRNLGIKTIDFLLPDVSHNNKNYFYRDIGDGAVYDYLKSAFDAWLIEDKPDVHVRIFNSLILHLLNPNMHDGLFDGQILNYLIIETNGDIETLDALRVCQHGISGSNLNVKTHNLSDIKIGAPLVYQAMTTGFPLCDKCISCSEKIICNGGYLPHRYAKENGFNNPSVWCDDIYSFIQHAREQIVKRI
jgi:uncharacterized protein